ncbi:hypothetical protein ACTU3I_08110 [Microbacterium sp. RD1]|uniref:hypothetical protein n=1 Tax=Microbacterium sp. RD1 TaxID=3457313 RepID=UPI003FA5889E
MTPVPASPVRRQLGLWTLVLSLFAVLAPLVLWASPASAASQGAGFGSWAPRSALGWHGSMIAGGMHTYCILPGSLVPTDSSVDNGVRGDAGGLSPQQLVAINHLVTTHGQTDDPVEAASVGWAVKAIADREATVHAFGHTGDSLSGMIDWIFSRLAPEHSAAVQQRAEALYAEAVDVPVPAMDASLYLTRDEDDPRRGTVRMDGGAGTTAVLTLQNAVFTDSGSATREHVAPGSTWEITAIPPDETGAPFTVRAHGVVSAAIAPAVRYFTTAGHQSTAGPGGGVSYEIEAADSAPRPVVFSPGLTTQVASPEAASGPFVDDVTLSAVEGAWPRFGDGSFVPVRATAVVYRTDAAPVGPDVPADAVPVGDLALIADPARGAGTYRVTSEWEIPGPGYYTAVWEIAAAAQAPEVTVHLERDYRWAEEFATPSQIVHVPTPPPAPADTPRALAATGLWDDAGPRLAAGGLAAMAAGGALLAHLSARRRARHGG